MSFPYSGFPSLFGLRVFLFSVEGVWSDRRPAEQCLSVEGSGRLRAVDGGASTPLPAEKAPFERGTCGEERSESRPERAVGVERKSK